MSFRSFDNPQLSDISSYGKLRISGSSACRFLQTMTSCDADALLVDQNYGQCCRGLVLDSEAQLIDVVTLARSGDNEYMVLSSGENFQELLTWLNAHSQLEYEGEPVFPHILLEDESEAMCMFALYGPDTQAIVSELCGDSLEEDPPQDVLCLAAFDGVPVMLLIENSGGDELRFVILTLVSNKELVWNILLSFPEIELADENIYVDYLQQLGATARGIEGAAYLDPLDVHLEHLMRPDGSFVGARALVDKHPGFSFSQ